MQKIDITKGKYFYIFGKIVNTKDRRIVDKYVFANLYDDNDTVEVSANLINSFIRKSDVVNVRLSDDNLTGFEINLNYIPVLNSNKIQSTNGTLSRARIKEMALATLNKRIVNNKDILNNSLKALYDKLNEVWQNYVSYEDVRVNVEVVDKDCFKVLFKSKYIEIRYNNGYMLYIKHINTHQLRNSLTNIGSDCNFTAQLILALLGFIPKYILSAFTSPRLDDTVREQLSGYTGHDYIEINDQLRSGEVDFGVLTRLLSLYQYISQCHLHRNLLLFRGVNYGVSVGKVSKLDTFTSTSLSFEVAQSFGDESIFIIKAGQGLECFLINLISEFRNREYEVLLNFGYRLKVERQIGSIDGSNIFVCSLIKDNKAIRKILFGDDDDRYNIIAALYSKLIKSDLRKSILITTELASRTPCIRLQLFTVVNGIEGFEIDVASKKSSIELRKLDNKGGKECCYFSKDSAKLYDDIVAKILPYIKDTLLPIDSIYFQVFRDVLTEIIQNGYICHGEVLNSEHGIKENEFKLSINGDNDDKIVLFFKIDKTNTHYILFVRAKSNGKVLDKSVKAEDFTKLAPLLVEFICRYLKLNWHNRVDKIINLIAKYKKTGYTLDVQNDLNIVIYNIDAYPSPITVSVSSQTQGIDFEYIGKHYTSNYFDNILNVASNVYSLLNEEVI